MTKKRRITIVFLFVFFGLIALVWNIIFFFPLDSLRQWLEQELQKQTSPWQTKVEEIKLHYFPPGLEIKNLTLSKPSTEIDQSTKKPKTVQLAIPQILLTTTWNDLLFHVRQKKLNVVNAEMSMFDSTITVHAELAKTTPSTPTTPIAPEVVTIPGNPRSPRTALPISQPESNQLDYEVNIDANQLKLTQLSKIVGFPIQGEVSFSFHGTLAITDRLKFVLPASLGTLQLDTNNVGVGDGKTLVDLGKHIPADLFIPKSVREPLPLPNIKLASFQSQFELQKGKLLIKSWKNKSGAGDKAIQLSLEGNLDFGQPLSTSSLNFFAKIGLEPNAMKSLLKDILNTIKDPNVTNLSDDIIRLVTEKINPYRRSDGQFGFDIKGTLANPKPKPNKMHP